MTDEFTGELLTRQSCLPVFKPCSSEVLVPLVDDEFGVLVFHPLTEGNGHHETRVANPHTGNPDWTPGSDWLLDDLVRRIQVRGRVILVTVGHLIPQVMRIFRAVFRERSINGRCGVR